MIEMRTGVKAAIVSVVVIVAVISVIAYIEYRNTVIAEEMYKVNRVLDCINDYGGTKSCIRNCQDDRISRGSSAGQYFGEMRPSECKSFIESVDRTYF